MDVCGRILLTRMPAIHAGMTEICISGPAGKRKLMKRSLEKTLLDLELSNASQTRARGHQYSSQVHDSAPQLSTPPTSMSRASNVNFPFASAKGAPG